MHSKMIVESCWITNPNTISRWCSIKYYNSDILHFEERERESKKEMEWERERFKVILERTC